MSRKSIDFVNKYGFFMFCGALAFAMASVVVVCKDSNKRRKDAEAKVAAYAKTLPNYADSLVLFVDKNKETIRDLADSVNALPAGAQRDGVAQRLGYLDAKADEYAVKQAEVDARIAEYRDSLMKVR